MTPEEAQHILAHIDRLKLTDFTEPEARAALETIADMRTEYTVEYQPVQGPEWYRVSDWSEEYPLIDGEELNPRERIVKRYVTAPQPLGENQ